MSSNIYLRTLRFYLPAYLGVTAVKFLWAFLTFGLASLFTIVVPNPLAALQFVASIIMNFQYVIESGQYFYLMYPAFGVAQCWVLFLAAKTLIAQYRATKAPDFQDAPLDARRLGRWRWTTPAAMTFAIIVTCYVLAMIPAFMGLNFFQRNAPGPWPFYIGLFFAAIGLLWGRRFSAAARGLVGGSFGVQYLPGDHWLTLKIHALADKLNLPHPDVGVTDAVNAFAVGTSASKASVVIGKPLIANLSPEELDAVIGHELGHIASGDMARMQFAEGYQSMFANVFNLLALFAGAMAASAAKRRSEAQLANGLGQVVAMVGRNVIFFSGELIVKGLSRSREFYADAIGASLASPQAMIGALDKLSRIPATATAAEHQYGYLMFKGVSLSGLFATHPTIAQRKADLKDGAHLAILPRRGTLK